MTLTWLSAGWRGGGRGGFRVALFLCGKDSVALCSYIHYIALMTYVPSPDEMAVRRFERTIRKVRVLPCVITVGAAANDNDGNAEPFGLYFRREDSRLAVGSVGISTPFAVGSTPMRGTKYA